MRTIDISKQTGGGVTFTVNGVVIRSLSKSVNVHCKQLSGVKEGAVVAPYGLIIKSTDEGFRFRVELDDTFTINGAAAPVTVPLQIASLNLNVFV